MKKNWLVAEKKFEDILKQILHNRGINPEDQSRFLKPEFERDLHDSSLLPDFGKYKQRIARAVAKDEKVGIFADYDADGIPGAAFLSKALNRLGIDSVAYIPSRDEGYGLNIGGIDYLKEKGCSLIITVDLGIKSLDEAEYCRSQGIDLIITDHHLPGKKIPQALAVINPKLPESNYPYKELCGAGVIFKLIYGLKDQYEEIDDYFLKWNLDLIAISTISDVVPLTGENRVMAAYGLVVLRKTKNPGLLALCRQANIIPESIGAYQIGYMVGPRLNAPGRIQDAMKSFLLLTESDSKVVEEIAAELEIENTLRQEMMVKMLKEADEKIAESRLDQENIIVIRGDWPRGIIGPSASRIAEKYSRPVIVLSEEPGLLTGSARSINDINITELLEECSGLLIKYGGHKGAAGLSLSPNQYQKFYDKMLSVAKEKIKSKQLTKLYKADVAIDFNELTFDLAKALKQLEPYGMGNPRPVFATSKAFVCEPKFVGADKNHLSAYIEHQNKRIKSIYFNCNEKSLKHSDNIDLLYSIDEEEWNGRHYLKINVVDMELAG